MSARALYALPVRLSSLLLFVLLLPGGAWAQSNAEGDPPGTEGLLADVVRIVDSLERTGWFLDDEAHREALPMVLESVCRTSLAARERALSRLREQRVDEPELVFARAHGEMTDEVELALTHDRQFELLHRALTEARSRCPFWVTPELDFEGRQTERNKFAVHIEGGGIGQLRYQAGEPVLGAGGNGRLLLGRGFGDHFSLLAGGELGGGALLKSTDRGQFTLNYIPAVPIVARFHNVAWLYDVELAPVALFESNDLNLSYGARIGVGIGLGVLRFQDFLPWAGIAASYEHFFAGGGRESAEFVRVGARVGFRWLP